MLTYSRPNFKHKNQLTQENFPKQKQVTSQHKSWHCCDWWCPTHSLLSKDIRKSVFSSKQLYVSRYYSFGLERHLCEIVYRRSRHEFEWGEMSYQLLFVDSFGSENHRGEINWMSDIYVWVVQLGGKSWHSVWVDSFGSENHRGEINWMTDI